jgi:hypothetical protein
MHMSRTVLGLLCSSLVLAFSLGIPGDPPYLQAQTYTSYADIRAKVGSFAGPMVPGAYVQVRNSAGKTIQAGYTNSRGVYRASRLPEGTYQALVSKKGVGSGSASFQICRGTGSALVTAPLK